tara:strand:+ start:500 stop:1012 length:513 start_codon:yes stop_codon:yes gene_type:complete
MRDLIAIIVASILVISALTMATSLHWHHRSHERLRKSLKKQGRSILAEVPTENGLLFFSHDKDSFYWSNQCIPKHKISSVELLISGAVLAVARTNRSDFKTVTENDKDNSSPENVERERWDVKIEVDSNFILVACGSIRQQVSQELARNIFETVKASIKLSDKTNYHSDS